MCKYVVRREMLGSREQGWSLWNGKEVVEMTSKEIASALLKGDEIHGLKLSESEELVLDDSFYTKNIMEHRQVGNYKPMVEAEGCMANVFYTVIGKNNKGMYEVVSSKFERAEFSEEKVKALFEVGVISAGLKIENNMVYMPVDKAKAEVKGEVNTKNKMKPVTESKETEKK